MTASIINKNSTIGIIGLGIMGSSMASNLLSRGFKVHIFNRTEEKARPLIDKGAIFHYTPRELAAFSDLIMTSLTDQDAVDSVAFGEDGFLEGMRRAPCGSTSARLTPPRPSGMPRRREKRGS